MNRGSFTFNCRYWSPRAPIILVLVDKCETEYVDVKDTPTVSFLEHPSFHPDMTAVEITLQRILRHLAHFIGMQHVARVGKLIHIHSMHVLIDCRV